MQELERVPGFFDALFLGNGQDFVLEISFCQIIQTLARHGGVLDAGFRREKCQDGIHQGALPGGAGGLDDDAEGLVHQAGSAGQIGGELVGGLPDDAGSVESPGDALQQVRGAEELEGGCAGGGCDWDGGMAGGFGSGSGGGGGGGGKALVLEHFEG